MLKGGCVSFFNGICIYIYIYSEQVNYPVTLTHHFDAKMATKDSYA